MIISMDIFSYLAIIIPVLINVAFLTLMERKILGLAQLRKGPNKTSLAGVLQPMADAVKLFLKEGPYIYSSNYLLFLLGPTLALFLALWVWSVLPLLELPLTFSVSFVLLLLILSIGVFSVLLAGWASNSKYSLVGALRGVAQTISYEVSLALILLSVLLAYKSVNLHSLAGGSWGGMAGGLLLPMASVWFVTCLAETNRTPFDFAEGESELVSGFNTEYGGGGFALIFMAEYAMIMFLSALSVIVFGNLDPSGLTFAGLASLLMALWIWVRGTYPRYRYDMLMGLAWKSFLPFSLQWGMVIAWLLVVLL